MKILHINSYFSTSGLFAHLYDRQVQSGIDIDVYVPIPKNYPEDRLAARGQYSIVSRNHPRFTRWIFPWKHGLILKDLLNTYKFQNYDLTHAHSLFSNGWLAYQLKRRFQLPYIVAVRNADLRTFFQRMPWMRKTGIKILKEAEAIVFISRNTYNEVKVKYLPENFIQEFEAKSHLVANGIDDFWHEHKNNNPVKPIHNPLKLVVTSKIMATKRLIELAEQVQFYSENHHPTELHIIGPTWEENVLTTLLNNPVVHYHGPKNKEEMVDFYREMDIFAMLSYPETFGLVYVEAMSQGLPVIYTQGEGFDNFFPDKTIGISVPPHNQEAFDEALNYLIDPTNLSRIQGNTVESISDFNWDDINKKYLDLYQELFKGVDNHRS